MKSFHFLLLLLLSGFCNGQSQNSSGLITYHHSSYYHVPGKFHAGAVAESLLLFNSNESSYYLNGLIKSIDVLKKSENNIPNENKRLIILNQNFKKKIIISKGNSVGTSYLVKDSLIGIVWKLSKNTKKIQNIECFSAQAEYRGRVWTAWYAPSIPVSSGPWKLYGLPGMILEAEDREKLVHFECVSIVFPQPTSITMELPIAIDAKSSKNPISIKEYAIFLEQNINNFEKMSMVNDVNTYISIGVTDIEIFDFEKNINTKRFQQKLSDIPKK